MNLRLIATLLLSLTPAALVAAFPAFQPTALAAAAAVSAMAAAYSMLLSPR